MIIDQLSNADQYAHLFPGLREAFAFLRRADLSTLPLGRHEIESGAPGSVYALVQQYDTRDPATAQWEAHRKFYDVQYVVSGAERMAYAPLGDLTETKAYDEKDDYLLLSGDGSSIVMRAGSFAVFGPQDAHQPTLWIDRPAPVRKIVVKVGVPAR